MDEKKGFRFDGRVIIGLLIIVVGTLLLLERLDIGVNISLRTYWPMLLIIIGIIKVASPSHSRQITTGLLFVIVGTLFQLNNLGYISFHIRDFWPLIIIFIGFSVIRGGFSGHGCCGGRFHRPHHAWGRRDACQPGPDGSINGMFNDSKADINTDHVDASVLFGGGEYRVYSKQFKGGSASATFGGIELDLRQAEMEGDSVILNVSATFGGIEISVPQHWQVVVEGFPVLGGMENKTLSPKDATKKLIVKGSATFGGIEIKN